MAEHTFTVTLGGHGCNSKVELDGVDISGLLRGIDISASVNGLTEVRLHPAAGRSRVELVAVLPESQIAVTAEPT